MAHPIWTCQFHHETIYQSAATSSLYMIFIQLMRACLYNTEVMNFGIVTNPRTIENLIEQLISMFACLWVDKLAYHATRTYRTDVGLCCCQFSAIIVRTLTDKLWTSSSPLSVGSIRIFAQSDQIEGCSNVPELIAPKLSHKFDVLFLLHRVGTFSWFSADFIIAL